MIHLKTGLYKNVCVAIFCVGVVLDVHVFHQLQEAPVSDSGKASPSEARPSKASRSPKDSLSPRTETDSSGDASCTSWVVDSSGFLSPTGPALKEVLDMVDGVNVPNILQHSRQMLVLKGSCAACFLNIPYSTVSQCIC